MSQPILVFDMDGVLVDVTESYRETIARTAGHFTGAAVSRERIQEYKNRGGFNDDWVLTHRIVADAGIDVPFETVKDHFQRLFLGNGTDGLISRERWIARPGTLEGLAERFRFAIFTGRPRAEAQLTLGRFAPPALRFDPLLAMEDIDRRKPHPEGLLRILCDHPGCRLFYVGDTIDDARCAEAAGVPFIAVGFHPEGAFAEVQDINELAGVLPL